MRTITTSMFLTVLLGAAAWSQTPPAKGPASNSPASKAAARPGAARTSAANPALLKAKAPDVFKAQFNTTKGDFVVEVHRDWAPLDRKSTRLNSSHIPL